MANHASAKKRIRSSQARRLQNRYQHKSTRTAIKQLLMTTEREPARKLYARICSMIDKLRKRGVMHRNKAARKKAQLAGHLNGLSG